MTKNKTAFLVLIIIALAIGFAGGRYFNERVEEAETITANLTIDNRDTGKPEGVDFSLFWDTYNVIQDRYVDRENLDTQKLVYGAIEGMVGAVGDPYTVFLNKEQTEAFTDSIKGEFGGVGIEIGIREERLTVIAPLEGTPGEKAGLLAGDFIIAIDGKDTIDIQLFEAVEQIRGPIGTAVILTIAREGNGDPKDISVVRDTIEIPTVRLSFIDGEKYELNEGKKLARIRVHTFNKKVDDQFRDAAKELIDEGATGIILDLRNNPGGLLDSSVNLASYFLEPDVVVVTERFGNGSENAFKSNHNAQLAGFPVVVLINKGSASASEILAGALRDQLGITIVGEQSFGKGSVQQVEDLRQNTSLKVTIAKWLTPSGLSINDEGITPDIEIEHTKEHTENEEDPQLEKAIEILNNL
ncbi:MAG: S41 family peptidase [Parcubacteria group bacterium]